MKNYFLNAMIRSYAKLQQPLYTQQPLDFSKSFYITPQRYIPPHIPRPIHADNLNYKTSNEFSLITNKNDLYKLRKACKIVAEAVRRAVKGVECGDCKTTDDIDVLVHDYIISQDAYPSSVGYMGFPKSLCTSPNEVVCHGIPNKRILNKGDFVNIDITAFYDGYHGDSSAMACVGKVHPNIYRLINEARVAMFKGISFCRPGKNIKGIGQVIEQYLSSKGLSVCKEFSGHGIGREIHMYPQVLHFDTDKINLNVPGLNCTMRKGMVFTIEPIVLLYPYDVLFMAQDNWTVFTPNNPSAQWEHTILVTDDGVEVLTKRTDEILLL